MSHLAWDEVNAIRYATNQGLRERESILSHLSFSPRCLSLSSLFPSSPSPLSLVPRSPVTLGIRSPFAYTQLFYCLSPTLHSIPGFFNFSLVVLGGERERWPLTDSFQARSHLRFHSEYDVESEILRRYIWYSRVQWCGESMREHSRESTRLYWKKT